jgi:hypothetical protein
MSDTMSNEQIMDAFKAIRTQLVDLEKSVKIALKSRGSKAAAKSDKPKRAAGPWALWAKEMPIVHPAEFTTFKAETSAAAEAEGKKAKGVHILFAKVWRDSHTAEWDAFSAKAKVDRENAVTTTVTTEVVAAKPEKAVKAVKPGKAAAEKRQSANKKKDTVDKSTVNVTVIPDTEEVTLSPMTLKGVNYLHTSDGDCWHAASDGSMGKWAGAYDAVAGSIDASASEPEME